LTSRATLQQTVGYLANSSYVVAWLWLSLWWCGDGV